MILNHEKSRRTRRGGALVAALVIVFALAGMAVSVFSLSLARSREANAVGSQIRALYMADSGITQSLNDLPTYVKANQAVPQTIGTYDLPIELSDGRFWCDVVDNGDGSFTVTSNGISSSAQRAVQAVLMPVGDNWYDHALHAGNSSGDPTYTLSLGGDGASADEVTGGIYAGGDLEINGDASVNGDLFASGDITGAVGDEGVTHPTPDIDAMAYEVNNDVDVAASFSSGSEVWSSSVQGGSAWQMPEADPAHIFRKNPDDRADENNGTVKDDYYLEDPYMPLTDYTASYGGTGHSVSIGDQASGTDGSGLVYYIDGNLWVHNKSWSRMRITNDLGGEMRITFIVKGNVYYSDDLTVVDPTTDGIGIIAIVDEFEPDSGNIYMGDPRFGTLDRVEAFMYAENDYHDLNLSADGSKHVTVVGNMTAGNQVDIDRDYVQADGTIVHSKLSVEFDDRLSKGTIALPGIPTPSANLEGFQVVMWREITIDAELQALQN